MNKLTFCLNKIPTIDTHLSSVFSTPHIITRISAIKKKFPIFLKILMFRKHPSIFTLYGYCVRNSKRSGILNTMVSFQCTVSKNRFKYSVPFFKFSTLL
jgi:hypothetical protein